MARSASVVILFVAVLVTFALKSLIVVECNFTPIALVDVAPRPISDSDSMNASSISSWDNALISHHQHHPSIGLNEPSGNTGWTHPSSTEAPRPLPGSDIMNASSNSALGEDPISHHQQHPSIRLGELPGYTGWGRPSYTDAPLYEIEYVTPAPNVVHDKVTIIVTCQSPRCSTSTWALFYVRMYGPAILTGKVTSINRGRYRIEFLPRDVGKYWIEVVLTFSKSADIGDFPLSERRALIKSSDPAYEGHLLPGFPFAIEVTGDGSERPEMNRRCGADDLRILSLDDGMRVARWKVFNKVNSVNNKRPVERLINLSGYQEGRNSLGIWADYRPTNCDLIPAPFFQPIISECIKNRLQGKQLHFVFIGDSVVRLQMEMMMRMARSPSVKTTRIATYGGIIQTMNNITSGLEALDFERDDVVILFNSGLHDIGVFCRRDYAINSSVYSSDPSEYPCIDQYQEQLTSLVKLISTMPARVKIFQTTSAAWMKWGNYGTAWSPGMAHVFTTSPHVVDEFNSVALRVLDDFDGFDINDGYWITLARPDNRQIDHAHAAGKHLVHPGLEVLRAMGRTWMTLALSRLGCDISATQE